MNRILDEIKLSFKTGSTLIKLIYVNLAVFLSVKIIQIFLILFAVPEGFESFIRWIAVPASLPDLIRKPWTLLTYMFLHEGFLHILFNLLWLFWFGRIFLEYWLRNGRGQGRYIESVYSNRQGIRQVLKENN